MRGTLFNLQGSDYFLSNIYLYKKFCSPNQKANIEYNLEDRRTKFQNLNICRRVLQLSFTNPLKPSVQSRIKMHQNDQQFYCLFLFLSGDVILQWHKYFFT